MSFLPVLGCCPGSLPRWVSTSTRTTRWTRRRVSGGGRLGVVIVQDLGEPRLRPTDDRRLPLVPGTLRPRRKAGVTRPMRGIRTRRSLSEVIGTMTINPSVLPWPTIRRFHLNLDRLPLSLCCQQTGFSGIPQLPTTFPQSSFSRTSLQGLNKPSRCRMRTCRSGSPDT